MMQLRRLALCLLAVAAVQAEPVQLWQQKIDGYADKPTVADLNGDNHLEVVVNTDKGKIQTFAGTNGALLWELAAPDERFLNAPIVASVRGDQSTQIIVAGYRYGTIFCLDGTNGKILWQQAGKGDGIQGSPTVADLGGGRKALLYVDQNKVNCLDAGSGNPIWAQELPSRSNGSVTVGPVGGSLGILAGTNDGRLYCFDATGGMRWNVTLGGRLVKPALIIDADGTGEPAVFAAGSSLYRISPDGKLLWTWAPASGRGISSALAAGDMMGNGKREIVCATSDGGLYCISPAGKQLWRFEVTSDSRFQVGSTPALVDINNDGAMDALLTSPRSDDPRVFAVNGRNGKALWSLQTKMFSQCCPAVAELGGDGGAEVVFCVPDGGGTKGWLSAVRLGTHARAGWPKFGGGLANTGAEHDANVDAAALLIGHSPFPVTPVDVSWFGQTGLTIGTPTGPTTEPPSGPTPGPTPSAGRPSTGIAVRLNDQWLLLNPPAKMVGDSVMVPLRGIFEALGATVKYDGATKTITAVRADTTVSLRLGSRQAYVGGKAVTLAVAARELNGSTYVPLRFVGEAFGATVKWDPAGRNVLITTTP